MVFPEGFRGFVQRFGAGGHPDGVIRAQARDEGAGHEQIFLEVVPPFPFHGIKHLEVPVRSGAEGGALKSGMGDLQEQRGNVFLRLEGEARIVSVFHAERVHEGCAGRIGAVKMIDVAAVHERTQHETHRTETAGGRSVGQCVADEQSAGGAVENERAQKNDFLFAFAAEAEGEGDAVVRAGHFLQMTPAFGMDHAGMQTRGKRDVMLLHGDGIFNRGQKHVFSRCCLHCEQSVVSAGVAPRNGTGGVVSQTVRKKPFSVHAAVGI